MKIELIKIGNIIPYDKNPRINDKTVDAVANSIQEFGFKNPVILDKNNVIVCGHTRYAASKKLKLKEIPCIYADDLTDEQIKAYRLADNKTAELAEWDFDLLDDEINDIFDIDMSDFGFEILDEELEHERQADIVQGRVENILNLDKGNFEGVGKYDIPKLEPVFELPPITRWIPFNFVLSDKPTVVSDSQLDSMSGTELFRTVNDSYNSSTDIGYTSKDVIKQISTGDFTMYSDSGGSAHGKAIYFAANFNSSASYGGSARQHPQMMRAKITGGNGISESSLSTKYNTALSRGDKLALACSNADSSSARNLYGLAKGYTHITPSKGSWDDYHMILNRSCLTVSSTTKDPSGRRSW